MTLCVAYIRQVNETEELVFATDSCLTGGEKWKHGIKLFRIPKRDFALLDIIFAFSLLSISILASDNIVENPKIALSGVLIS